MKLWLCNESDDLSLKSDYLINSDYLFINMKQKLPQM